VNGGMVECFTNASDGDRVMEGIGSSKACRNDSSWVMERCSLFSRNKQLHKPAIVTM
jgi:hypothetical protein